MIPSIILFIDILIRFNTGYYQDGNIVLDRREIVKQYLIKDFWIDFIPLLSLTYTELMFYSFNFTFFEYLQLIRFFQLLKLSDKLESYFNMLERFPTITILFKLTHYCGCGFLYVGILENNQNSWINNRHEDYTSNSELYLDSLYFAFITMITVGYGDISPITPIEKIYGIIITIISCGVFAYAVNIVGTIFQQKSEQNAMIKKERFKLLTYLQSKKVHKHLQIKVLKFLDHIHKKQYQQEQNMGLDILNEKIPLDLKNQVLKEYYLQILEANKFLRENFPTQILESIAVKMQEKMYGPHESLQKQGEIDESIIFVIKGEIEVNLSRKIISSEIKRKLKQVNNKINIFKGDEKDLLYGSAIVKDCIGINKLFILEENEFNLISKTMTSIAYISRYDFLQVLQQFPEFQEKFQELKDEVLEKSINVEQCFQCRSLEHQTTNCFYIQNYSNKPFIKLRYIFSRNQERLIYKRWGRQYRMSSLSAFSDINYYGRQIRVENSIGIEFTQFIQDMGLDYHSLSDKQFVMYIPLINQYEESYREDFIMQNFKNYTEADQKELENSLESSNEDDIEGNTSIIDNLYEIDSMQFLDKQNSSQINQNKKRSSNIQINLTPQQNRNRSKRNSSFLLDPNQQQQSQTSKGAAIKQQSKNSIISINKQQSITTKQKQQQNNNQIILSQNQISNSRLPTIQSKNNSQNRQSIQQIIENKKINKRKNSNRISINMQSQQQPPLLLSNSKIPLQNQQQTKYVNQLINLEQILMEVAQHSKVAEIKPKVVEDDIYQLNCIPDFDSMYIFTKYWKQKNYNIVISIIQEQAQKIQITYNQPKSNHLLSRRQRRPINTQNKINKLYGKSLKTIKLKN